MKSLSFCLATIILVLMASSSGHAIINFNPPTERFGMVGDVNYRLWFESSLQGADVYAPKNRAQPLMDMLLESFQRLQGDRRPVLIKDATQFTTELWIVKSDQVIEPTLQIEVHKKSPHVRYTYSSQAALILIPENWTIEKLTNEQKDRLDRIVLQATSELVIITRPGQTYGESDLRYEDYVRNWQSARSKFCKGLLNR